MHALAMKINLLRTNAACLAMAFALLVLLPAPLGAEEAAVAPEEAGVAPISGMQIEPQGVPTASKKAPAGLLPIPDYSANIWTRQYLTGDWWGARTYLANKGVQFGVELNQYVQGVTNGGRDRTAAYGGTADYTVNLDLMRMGILPGALIKFRAESRFGSSVNGKAGPILPVNTDFLFPVTDTLDEDIAITVTDLNYTQFLSPYLGVFFGKLDTLDGDPNEFASGRGTSQFMNANFIFNPAMALRLPYSTLGAGLIVMPIPPSPKGGITISSLVMNTQDASTTSGFDDFGDGTTWSTEIDFQYRLGPLPGGMNVGGIYSFNQDFARLNSRLVLQPGEGLVIPKEHSTWAVFWSAWQYVFVEQSGNQPIDTHNGEPDLQGVGLFVRLGFADRQTNPLSWAVSGGMGGRGVIPYRDNDTFGIGYYYNRNQPGRLLGILGVEDSAQGFEVFYNIAVTPACRLTLDLQVVNPRWRVWTPRQLSACGPALIFEQFVSG
jgi:porin